MDTSKIMDRIKGMVFGAMYGDALGAPHEFRKDKIKMEDLTMKPLRRFNRYQKTWSQTVPGQYTDDTEMALIILAHLIHKNGFDEREIIFDYMKWANAGTKFMGRNTKDLFKGVKTLSGYDKRFSTKYPTQKEKDTALSNGALMRCYPFAIYGLKHSDYLDVAMKDCIITNPSKIAQEVEKTYLVSLMKALQGKSKKSIVGNYDLTHAPDVKTNKGLCTHGLYCTYYGLMNYDNFQDAIKNIILLGGDCDTNGSCAGCTIGAYYGFDEMIKNKEFADGLKIILSHDSMQGDYKRPPEYRPNVMLELMSHIEKFIS